MQLRTWMNVVLTSLFFALSAPLLAADGDVADSGMVNINTASAEQLAEALQGVGLSKAAEIVAHREMYGAFVAIEELVEVKGIGETLLERNRSRILISSE